MYSAARALTQAARASDADFLKADSENPFADPLPINPERPVPPSRVGGRGAPSGQKHLISTYHFPRAMPPIPKSGRPRYFPIILFGQPAFRRQQRGKMTWQLKTP